MCPSLLTDRNKSTLFTGRKSVCLKCLGLKNVMATLKITYVRQRLVNFDGIKSSWPKPCQPVFLFLSSGLLELLLDLLFGPAPNALLECGQLVVERLLVLRVGDLNPGEGEKESSLINYLQIVFFIFFKNKWAIPGLFFVFIFRSFSSKHHDNFYR